ncbi:MAG: CDP-alcohol phosphatidyltransferase family protein [Candidatus Bathyarchaeia archaeon]
MLTCLRRKLECLIEWLASNLHRIGVTPNMLTVAGFLVAASSGIILSHRISYTSTFILAPSLILLSGFFDAVDGSLARVGSQTTKFGGVLDSTLDRFGEIFIISGMVLGGLSSVLWGLCALSSSLMVSYTRARVEAEGLRLEGVGVAERPERIIILALSTFLGYVEYGVIIISVLSTITVAQRILYAYEHLT